MPKGLTPRTALGYPPPPHIVLQVGSPSPCQRSALGSLPMKTIAVRDQRRLVPSPIQNRAGMRRCLLLDCCFLPGRPPMARSPRADPNLPSARPLDPSRHRDSQ